MANTPTPVVKSPYPVGQPVARWQGTSAQPPHVVPRPGPYTAFKSGLPNLPSVSQLFHHPRKAGQGSATP